MFHTPLPKPDFCHTNTFAHYWALFCSLVLCQVSFLDNSWTIERFSHWIQTGIFVLHVKLVLKKTLAKNIPKFHKKGKLGFFLERIFNNNSDLLSVLTTIKAVYHHNCFSKYCDSKLKRFNKPSKKRKSTEDENGRKLRCLLAESRERLDLLRCWCSKKDNISGNRINHEIGSRERFQCKTYRNGH